MEPLTKQQIVLLCLLVSFVSSIATGIVTVALLDQAPPAVTQTINRVVERTIEKVSSAATSTTETIIVREDQAVVDAIARAAKTLVRLTFPDGSSALGIIVSGKGKIIAFTNGIVPAAAEARLDGGNIVSASLESIDQGTGIALFQAEQNADPHATRAYSSAVLADSSKLKLGQAIVAIGGTGVQSVASGIISSIDGSRLFASIRDPAFDSHAILVNLLGEVIGMKDRSSDNSFISSNQLKTYATP